MKGQTDARALSRGCLQSRYDETCCLHEEKISIQWMTHDTSPQTHGEGYRPCPQSPTCSKTHNENLYSPQMAISSLHSNLREGTPFLQSGGSPKSRELRRHLNGVINTRCSHTSTETIEKLTRLSVYAQEQSTKSYSPVHAPKASDRQACHINDRQSTKMHNTSWGKVVVVEVQADSTNQ